MTINSEEMKAKHQQTIEAVKKEVKAQLGMWDFSEEQIEDIADFIWHERRNAKILSDGAKVELQHAVDTLKFWQVRGAMAELNDHIVRALEWLKKIEESDLTSDELINKACSFRDRLLRNVLKFREDTRESEELVGKALEYLKKMGGRE